MFIGFDPVFDKNSKVLILGSFPSVKSREEGFYYGNKNNRFWRMLSTVYHDEMPLTIPEKKDYLRKHQIALWDIVKKYQMTGSKDENIKNLKPSQINDINDILQKSSISKILCNGSKSFEITKKFAKIKCEIICLPSTSSANVNFDIDKWQGQLCTKGE